MPRVSTEELARQLAKTSASFADLLGDITADGLLQLVCVELGHAGILDALQPHGDHRAMAHGPRTILHVISGNTPHAGLQSLMRGLLVGAHNLCKLPSGGLVPEIAAFRAALPPDLAQRVELSETLPDEWLARADAVIVFGGDDTIDALRQRMRADQIFVAHGHRVSLAMIFNEDGGNCFDSVPAAAHAVALFDQQGCLSPQAIYVQSHPRDYAEKLAAALAQYEEKSPRGALPAGEAAAITALRDEWRFRASNDPANLALWTSPDSTAWTVLYHSADPGWTPSPLNRTIFVKPLPADCAGIFAGVQPHLSAIGIWPATRANADRVMAALAGPARICPLEKMQLPPLTWHQDGAPPLSALVRWTDFEES